MKPIVIKGWIARDKVSGMADSEVSFYDKKPILEDNGYYNIKRGGEFSDIIIYDLDHFKKHLKKGECKKVKIFIGEVDGK